MLRPLMYNFPYRKEAFKDKREGFLRYEKRLLTTCRKALYDMESG